MTTAHIYLYLQTPPRGKGKSHQFFRGRSWGPGDQHSFFYSFQNWPIRAGGVFLFLFFFWGGGGGGDWSDMQVLLTTFM